MADLGAAFGLALAIEGLLCAAPDTVRRAMGEAAQSPTERLRLVGVATALLGLVVVWRARKAGLWGLRDGLSRPLQAYAAASAAAQDRPPAAFGA